MSYEIVEEVWTSDMDEKGQNHIPVLKVSIYPDKLIVQEKPWSSSSNGYTIENAGFSGTISGYYQFSNGGYFDRLNEKFSAYQVILILEVNLGERRYDCTKKVRSFSIFNGQPLN